MVGGGAGGDAPDAQASALGLPHGQPQPPKRLSHHGIQRITVEFSENSRMKRPWKTGRSACFAADRAIS